jgi:hypothetical protein
MLLHVRKQLWLRTSSNQHLSVLTLLPSHLYLKALLPGSCSTPVHLHTIFGCTSSTLCRGALRGCTTNLDDILTCTYLMREFAGAPCSFRNCREEERRRYSQVLCRLQSVLVVALRKKMMLMMKTTLWIVRTRRARVKVKGDPCKLDTGVFNLHLCPKLSCNWLSGLEPKGMKWKAETV